MSLIFTREIGARRIPSDVLEGLTSHYNDGWGMCYFDEENLLMKRRSSIHMENFIQSFRDKENQDLKIVAFLHKCDPIKKHVDNLQPFATLHEGLLFVDCAECDMRELLGVSDSDLEGRSSAERIIAKLYNDFTQMHFSKMNDFNIWSSFIRSNIVPVGTKLILMLKDGSILYNNAEDGISLDKNKLWFSDNDLLRPKEDEEDEMEEEMSELKLSEHCDAIEQRFDDYNEVLKEDLRGLTLEEITHLTVSYGFQISEILKFGKSGVKSINLTGGEYLDDDDFFCYDCGKTPEDKGKMYVEDKETRYICDTCFSKNGPTIDFSYGKEIN